MNDTENTEAPIVTVAEIQSVENFLHRIFMNSTDVTGTNCLDMRFSNIELARRAGLDQAAAFVPHLLRQVR